MQRLQQGDHIGTIGAAFYSQCALSDCGQTILTGDQRAMR